MLIQTNVEATSPITGSGVPESVIPLEVTSLRSNTEFMITSVCKGSSSTSISTFGTGLPFFPREIHFRLSLYKPMSS